MRSPCSRTQVVQRAGQRGLAAAGQAGEEQHQALLVGRRAVGVDDRRRPSSGSSPSPVDRRGPSPGGVAPRRPARRARGRPRRRRGRPAARRPRRRRRAGRRRRGWRGAGRRARGLGGAGAGQREQQRPAGRRRRRGSVQVGVGQRRRRPARSVRPAYRSRDLRRGSGSSRRNGAELLVRGVSGSDPVRRRVVRDRRRPGPAAGPRGRPARRRRRRGRGGDLGGQARVTGPPGSSKPGQARGRRAVSSSRSSSSRGGRAVLGRRAGGSTRATSCQLAVRYLRPCLLAACPRPVVVAEIVRSGFVEGHHYGSVVALDADGARRLVGRRRRRAGAAALVQQAGPGARHGPGRARPADGDLLALACASHSGEPFHLEGVRRILALGRARRGRAADARRTTRSTTQAREELHPRRRREGARSLMNCSGKHAAMLATCVVNGWDTATYLDPEHPLQQAIADDLRRAHRRAGRGRRGRRLRRAAALHLAGRAGPGVPRAGARRPTGPEQPGGRRDPRAPGVRLGHPPRRARAAHGRSPARSARPAPSPATPSRCRTAARSRSRPTTAPPRVRPVLMAEALRRLRRRSSEPGVDADAVRRTGRARAARRRPAGRRDPGHVLTDGSGHD